MLQQPPEILYYLLGAFITDGCITVNGRRNKTYSSWISSIISQDADWVELIRNVICPQLPFKNYGNGGYVLQITNKTTGEWFIKHGCVPRKSLIVEYPVVPEQYFPDFLRGCIDGDGSISSSINKKTGKIIYKSYLCSASFNFLFKISCKLHALEIKNSICQVHKNLVK